MAIRSLFVSLRRNPYLHPHPLYYFNNSPSFSSEPDPLEEPTSLSAVDDDLKSRILRLRFPKRSATAALQRWVDEGRTVTISELRQISKDLRRSERFKHALEILTWMDAQGRFQLSAADHAIQLDLIIKAHSIAAAEEYFNNLPDSTSRKAAGLPLLHSYVKARATEKAEALMSMLLDSGLVINPHPFNEMMKLYMATGHFKKILSMVRQMKRDKIPCNVLSYNLWMSACGALSDVASAEMVHKSMASDKNVEVGWSTYSTLANIYIKFNLVEKALAALGAAERTLSMRNRLGFLFLITLYAALNDRDGVLRLWEASKTVKGRITCANYMCILSCLIKVDDLDEAERVFRTWESECWKYDIRVSNVLLGAYIRKGLIEKAEALHLRTLEKGGCPNYKTWEILMEGWVRSKEMDKAVEAMKKGFAMLKHCNWRPPSSIVMAIAEYFEEHGSVEDVKKYMRVVRRLEIVSLPLYKSLLRAHVHAGRAASGVLKMMEKDKIELDEEASKLIESVSTMDCIKITETVRK